MSATTQPWTPADLATLAQIYPHMRTKDVAVRMGRTEQGINYKAWALKIRKTPEYLVSRFAGRLQPNQVAPVGLTTRFPRGNVPWNAGHKGWQAGGLSVGTQFKAGGLPRNTQPIGSYRLVDHKGSGPRLEKKVREVPGSNDKRWTPVSRLVWEAANGPVPRGHLVVFKAGMVTTVLEHITLDRLECITRAQHASRNHPRNKSPEIRRLVQLKGAITRQVNRITRAHEAQQQPQGQPA